MTAAASQREVGVQEAKTHLSRLLQRVEAGERVVITRRGTPVAVLAAAPTEGPIELGWLRGQIKIDDDFDAPLADEHLWYREDVAG